MREYRNKRALSPVIATVILVAVAITVAVAVAYWMGGIAGQYTKFEKVEIQSAYCRNAGEYWNISISVKNTGTAIATLDKIFINGIEIDTYGTSSAPGAGLATTTLPTTGQPLNSGESNTFHVLIDGPATAPQWQYVSSGTTINIKIHSTGGMEYLKLVELV